MKENKENEFEKELKGFIETESEISESEPEIIGEEIIGLFYEFIFSKIAEVYSDERLKLTEDERKLLATATKKWLNYRLPKFLLKYPIDFEFAVAVLSVLVPKIVIIYGKQNNSNTWKERARKNEPGKENIE
ncbi:MAG: hypothetical protein NC925_03585 [Candidatus Omnitrophica bacterium]|nr:hypothetical protein [Candidatus Omnitrophota bacterium]